MKITIMITETVIDIIPMDHTVGMKEVTDQGMGQKVEVEREGDRSNKELIRRMNLFINGVRSRCDFSDIICVEIGL